MSRVLVTGGAGFIGVPLVSELVRRGAEVHALTTRAVPPDIGEVHWHRADLAHDATVDELMAKLAPESLVHLAWYLEHGHFWHAPENVIWVERSLRLARAFVDQGGKRLVMLGTCAEYDWSAADTPLHEVRSRLDPATLYGVAKDGLRRIVQAYAEREQVEFAWGRPFFIYGPGEAPERLAPAVIRSLLADEPVDTTRGEQVRDFMYVEDVAGAVVALLESEVLGEVNIASGVGVTVAEVVAEIARLVGRPELIRLGALPDRAEDPPLLLADVTRLREEVGFRPRFTLADGLAATVQWWREQPATAAAS